MVLSLLYNLSDNSLAQILNGQQAKGDLIFPQADEAFLALIYIRAKHLDAFFPAGGNIFRDLIGVPDDAGQQRRHIDAAVMAFQVSGLVSHHRISGGVGFIEGVGRKVAHFVEDPIGDFRADSIGHRPYAVLGAVWILMAVEEILPFLLHNVVLFLGHGPAHQIRPSIGVSRQAAADLHYLFLVHHAAVGDL